MRSLAGAFFLATLVLHSGLSAAASKDSLSEDVRTQEFAGDMLLIGIPLTALAATFFFTDDDPPQESQQLTESKLHFGGRDFNTDIITRMNGHARHDLMLAMGRTLAATYTLKYSVDAERPNGDGHSFPSGHSAVSFAGAEFIRKEYGWGWGASAYLLAGFVGYSRVKAEDHYTVDVLSGAAIGVLSNHDLREFLTPVGRLSIGPSFTEPQHIANTPWREESSTQFAPAPSVSVELRF